MSRMHLLYFLQLVVRRGYAFSFFEQALEEVALRIDEDGTLAPETKAYALFFLNVTIVDLLPGRDFDFLLERLYERAALRASVGTAA